MLRSGIEQARKMLKKDGEILCQDICILCIMEGSRFCILQQKRKVAAGLVNNNVDAN